MAREIIKEFVVENGVVVQGMVKITCNIAKGTGKDKVGLYKGLEQSLDYTGVTIGQLVDSASKSDVIELQAVWRELSTSSLEKEHQQVTSIKEMYNSIRVREPSDPFKAALKAIDAGKMTDTDLQAFIAALTVKAQGK